MEKANDHYELLQKDILYLLNVEPFYAFFIGNIDRVFSEKVPYAGVSFKNDNFILYINPTNYFSLPLNERIFILIHEMLHLIHNHLFERDGKNFEIWNYATDICINQMISNHYAVAPSFIVTYKSFENKGLFLPQDKTSDEYYKLLIDNFSTSPSPNDSDKKEKSSSNSSNNSKGSSEDSDMDSTSSNNSSNEKDSFDKPSISHDIWNDSDEIDEATKQILEKELEDKIQSAAENAGENTPEMFRQFEKTKDVSVTPWYVFLRRTMANKTSHSFKRTWKKPHRHLYDQAMGKKKKKKSVIHVIVDTSASIKEHFLKEFYQELNNLSQFDIDIIIIECDAQVQKIYNFKKKKEILFEGGGGTDFNPAFKAILLKEDRLLKTKPNLVICLTDGFGFAPEHFKYKTIFCLTENGRRPIIKESRKEITWGNTIFMQN